MKQYPLDSPRKHSQVMGCKCTHHKQILKFSHPWAFWPLPLCQGTSDISTLFQKIFSNPDVKEQSQQTLRLALQVHDIIVSPESQVKILRSINLDLHSVPDLKPLRSFLCGFSLFLPVHNSQILLFFCRPYRNWANRKSIKARHQSWRIEEARAWSLELRTKWRGDNKRR